MKRKDMPDDCCVIQAKMVRVGDRVRFRMTSVDIDHSESDRIALETHGIEGLKKLGYFGVLDRLKTTGVIES